MAAFFHGFLTIGTQSWQIKKKNGTRRTRCQVALSLVLPRDMFNNKRASMSSGEISLFDYLTVM
jgi:hypothetical protein